MSYVSSNRKRVVGALVTALAAVGVAVGSGASFTASTANPANTFSSGALEMSNSRNDAAIFAGSALKPGESTSGQVTIKNTGTVAGDFTLSEIGATDPFNADLKLEVRQSGVATPIYDGSFGGVPAGGIALGTYAAGAERTYAFKVTLPASADDSDENKTATATYRWDATTVAP